MEANYYFFRKTCQDVLGLCSYSVVMNHSKCLAKEQWFGHFRSCTNQRLNHSGKGDSNTQSEYVVLRSELMVMEYLANCLLFSSKWTQFLDLPPAEAPFQEKPKENMLFTGELSGRSPRTFETWTTHHNGWDRHIDWMFIIMLFTTNRY